MNDIGNAISIVDPLITAGGTVDVADAVIAGVVFRAAIDIDGIVKVEGRDRAGILNLLRKGGIPKGIQMNKDLGEVVLDVHVSVTYGTYIPDIAIELRERASQDVFELTGFRIRALNVLVSGVVDEPAPAK